MTESEVRVVAEEVLGQTLRFSGFSFVEVQLGQDHDGDAAFFVTAHFKPGSGVTSGSASSQAHTALWTRLLALDEVRFPYLAFRYPDDELLVGDDESGEA